MTLTAVGRRYDNTSARDRVDLLRSASSIIERRGYASTDRPGQSGVSIIAAMAKASAVYSNVSEAFSDGMFVVNSRFLILTETSERSTSGIETWTAFCAEIDQHAACAFLEGTAAIIETTI